MKSELKLVSDQLNLYKEKVSESEREKVELQFNLKAQKQLFDTLKKQQQEEGNHLT